jgi:hypothetical protein
MRACEQIFWLLPLENSQFPGILSPPAPLGDDLEAFVVVTPFSVVEVH